MRKETYYRFEYIAFDGSRHVMYKRWRLTIDQAMAKFMHMHRFVSKRESCCTVMEDN